MQMAMTGHGEDTGAPIIQTTCVATLRNDCEVEHWFTLAMIYVGFVFQVRT